MLNKNYNDYVLEIEDEVVEYITDHIYTTFTKIKKTKYMNLYEIIETNKTNSSQSIIKTNLQNLIEAYVGIVPELDEEKYNHDDINVGNINLFLESFLPKPIINKVMIDIEYYINQLKDLKPIGSVMDEATFGDEYKFEEIQQFFKDKKYKGRTLANRLLDLIVGKHTTNPYMNIVIEDEIENIQKFFPNEQVSDIKTIVEKSTVKINTPDIVVYAGDLIYYLKHSLNKSDMITFVENGMKHLYGKELIPEYVTDKYRNHIVRTNNKLFFN